MIFSELYEAGKLHQLDGAEIVAQYSSETRAQFERAARDGGTPVVIPVRDEERDLPATLLALSRSTTPVLPVVVSNGSVDGTVAVAEKMGAHVIDMPEPGRTGATLRGAQYVIDSLGSKQALFIDGDEAVTPRWEAEMIGSLARADRGNGALVYGMLVWANGETLPGGEVPSLPARLEAAAVNIVRTLRRTLVCRNAVHDGLSPVVTGGNYGISFDENGRIMAELAALPGDVFIGEDWATRDAAERAGAVILGDERLATAVVTRGGRMSLRDLLGDAAARAAARERSYFAQYGQDIGFYAPAMTGRVMPLVREVQ